MALLWPNVVVLVATEATVSVAMAVVVQCKFHFGSKRLDVNPS